MVSGTSNRIAVLDGLRALAITLVLLRHSVQLFWSDLSVPYIPVGPFDLGAFFLNGWMGVDLFFVLSGFLLASQLIGQSERQAPFSETFFRYIRLRFFRIAPAYYLVLTLAVLGLIPYHHPIEKPESLWGRYGYHLVFLQDFYPSDIVVAFWSLAVEMKFYLCLPFVVFAVLNMKAPFYRWTGLLCCVLLSPVLRSVFGGHFTENGDYFWYIRSVFYYSLDGLFVGVFCAFLWRDVLCQRIIQKRVVANLLFFSGAVMVWCLGSLAPLLDTGVSVFDRTALAGVLSFSFGAMMLGLLGQCAGYRIFEHPVLRFIALISYALYLVHMPLRSLAIVAMFQVVDITGLSDQISYLIYMPFFLSLSVLSATLLYVCVERPCIAWSKKTSDQKERGQS